MILKGVWELSLSFFLCVFILDSEYSIRQGEMLNIQFLFSWVLRKTISCSLHQDQMSFIRAKQNVFPVQLWMLSSNQHCLFSPSSTGIAVPHFRVGSRGEYQLSTGTQQHTSCTDLLAFPIYTRSFRTAKCRRGKMMDLNVCTSLLWSQRLLRMIASMSKWFYVGIATPALFLHWHEEIVFVLIFFFST